ncbi:MAG: GNAT family N-acetyltransferase [bacterium]|nr:GNAT family N-acetyltransferase [bacterium]
MCTEVQHGTKEYDLTVALRDEVLRKPLGLAFSPEELVEEKDSFHLTCWRDGMLVGCVILKPVTDTQVRMRQFAVRADWQGRGIGRALVNHLESFARDRGYNEIVLHARETAVGFYEKAGYEAHGDRFTEVTIPHFAMRKRLGD